MLGVITSVGQLVLVFPPPPWSPEGSLVLVPRVLVLVFRPPASPEGSSALIPRVLVLVFRPPASLEVPVIMCWEWYVPTRFYAFAEGFRREMANAVIAKCSSHYFLLLLSKTVCRKLQGSHQ